MMLVVVFVLGDGRGRRGCISAGKSSESDPAASQYSSPGERHVGGEMVVVDSSPTPS